MADDKYGTVRYDPDKSVSFVCPCGKSAVGGEEESGRLSVAHQLPMCDKFKALEPDAYMTYVREFYQKRIN